MKPSEMIQAALDSGIYKTGLYMCIAVQHVPRCKYTFVQRCQVAIRDRIYPYGTLVSYWQHVNNTQKVPTYEERVEFWLEFIEDLKKQNR